MEQFHLVTHKLHSPKTNHPLQALKPKWKRGTIHSMCALDFFIIIILAYK